MLRYTAFLWLSILASISLVRAQNVTEEPHLFLTLNDFGRIRSLAEEQPWAKKEEQKIVDAAASFPESYEKQFGVNGVALPPEGGAWGHYYACPGSGRALVYSPPNHNVCPDTGREFTGYPYDQVVYAMRANFLGSSALNLALAFRLTHNARYASEAASVLKAYADRYLSYPIHDNHNTVAASGARVFSQTLDESIWIVQMAWAYDLLRGSDALSAGDRRHIENDLLYSAAEVDGRAVGVTYNWQSWINTALAAVGYTLGDKELLARALDGPAGFRFQMREYVVDGFWIEETWGYQFYALTALTELAQMADKNGLDLWKEEPNLKALLDSPFGSLLPDGTLPAFNDSRVMSIYDQAPLYEYPYAATRDPLFAAVIGHGDHPRPELPGMPFGGNVEHGGRADREALLFGVPSVGEVKLPPMKSDVFVNVGYARLSAPSGDLTEVMKFGPHGGGHGHFDKLGEVIYAYGAFMSVDPGTQFYGVASHDTWDRTTVAHNTVVVDEKSQDRATGQLLSWQAERGFTAIEADAGPAYPTVSLRRRIVLTSRYILEITKVEAHDDADHTFDWVYHNYGVQSLALPAQPWSGFPDHDGYQQLSGNRVATPTADWQDVFRISSADKRVTGMHLWMLDDAREDSHASSETKVLTGFGLGPDLKVPVPYVMTRRKGRRTTFTVVMEPFTGSPLIHDFHRDTSGAYVVHGPGWTDTIRIEKRVSIHHDESH